MNATGISAFSGFRAPHRSLSISKRVGVEDAFPIVLEDGGKASAIMAVVRLFASFPCCDAYGGADARRRFARRAFLRTYGKVPVFDLLDFKE